MTYTHQPEQRLSSTVQNGLLVPAADFEVLLTDANVFGSIDIHDPKALNLKFHDLLIQTHDQIEKFLISPGENLQSNPVNLAEQLIANNQLETLKQIHMLLVPHQHPLVSTMPVLFARLEESRDILLQYDNSEFDVRDVAAIKSELPELLLALRDSIIVTQNQIQERPHDRKVDSLLAQSVTATAQSLDGRIPLDILHGTPGSAWDFVRNFGQTISQLGHEIRLLCNPMIAFEAPEATSLYAGTHRMSLALDGLRPSNEKVSLFDFLKLRAAALPFEAARREFLHKFTAK